jgi:hypothetical protein
MASLKRGFCAANQPGDSRKQCVYYVGTYICLFFACCQQGGTFVLFVAIPFAFFILKLRIAFASWMVSLLILDNSLSLQILYEKHFSPKKDAAIARKVSIPSVCGKSCYYYTSFT